MGEGRLEVPSRKNRRELTPAQRRGCDVWNATPTVSKSRRAASALGIPPNGAGKGGGDLAQVLGTVTRVDLVCEAVPAAQGLDRGIGDAARGRRGGRTDTEAVGGDAETGQTREGHKLRQDRRKEGVPTRF